MGKVKLQGLITHADAASKLTQNSFTI